MNATPAPIHDIVPPVPFFPYPFWMVLLVVSSALGLITLLVWVAKWVLFRKRKLRPVEKALAGLTLLRTQMGGISPHDFGVQVSSILRHYIQEEYGLRATTQTSLEFLESIQNNVVFSEEEKTMLRGFLETADLLKFAKAKVEATESTSLLYQAEQLVRTRSQDATSQREGTTQKNV